jgi:hypothetical protein
MNIKAIATNIINTRTEGKATTETQQAFVDSLQALRAELGDLTLEFVLRTIVGEMVQASTAEASATNEETARWAKQGLRIDSRLL